jgi:hypothetical protein
MVRVGRKPPAPSTTDPLRPGMAGGRAIPEPILYNTCRLWYKLPVRYRVSRSVESLRMRVLYSSLSLLDPMLLLPGEFAASDRPYRLRSR